ncbi:hypothetical protein AB4238_03140 [Shewanella sp. 10N.286.45.A1]|uniref:hypothetical protein n=1 Tax=Shewanella sp. 10N.286.45.A1 TaxID=3229694 RepID=UPI00354AFAF1
MIKVITVLTMVILAGCQLTQPTVPKDYIGEIAYIDDSIDNASRSSAHFFYLDRINGVSINNAIRTSQKYSYGSELARKGGSRELVVAKKQTFHLIGQVHHSAPVGYMVNAGDNYIVEGSVEFTPLKNNHYLVGGKISQEYSAVWIEDMNGNIVSDIIETSADDGKVKINKLADNPQTVLLERNKLQHFEHIRAGESAAFVVKKLGEPSEISFVEGNFFTQRRAKVIYAYDEIGTIEFNTVPGKDRNAHFVNEAILALQGESHLVRIKQELMTTDAAELRSLAKNYAKQNRFSTDVLDFIADRIWLEKDSTDSVMIDATSWLCKVLAKSANGRYKAHLEMVASSTSSKKLKKYANASLEDLPSSDQPYIAEVSLTEKL